MSIDRTQHTSRNKSGSADEAEDRLRDPEAIYNIGMVERITGIPAATLRAWERRYGFPRARRTAGGHRLYSQSDIHRLMLVRHHIDRGMQTAQAIRAVQASAEEETEHQKSQPGAGGHMPKYGEAEGGQATSLALGLQVAREQLLRALQKHDLQAADQLLGELLAFYTPEDLVLELLAPVMNRIGHLWGEGHISVATEHLASGYIRHRLLMWMVSGPPPRPVPPVVLACAPGEWHEGSLLMLAVLLRRKRWPISYLGQSVPMADLARFVREIQPSVVVLVAMSDETAATLADWPEWLPEAAATGKPAVGYGGLAFTSKPQYWQQHQPPGIYLGTTLREGLKNIESLLAGMYNNYADHAEEGI